MIKFLFEIFFNFPGIAPGCTANCIGRRSYENNLFEIECGYRKIESVPRVLIESMPNTTRSLYVCNMSLELHNKSGHLSTIPSRQSCKHYLFFFPIMLASFVSIRTKGSLQEIFPLNVSRTEITWINTIIDQSVERWGCMECSNHLHRHFIKQAHGIPFCSCKSSDLVHFMIDSLHSIFYRKIILRRCWSFS